LFIRLNKLSDNWHTIGSTRGVLTIVRFNGYPIPIPDTIVDGIRHRLTCDQPRVPYLQPGERVRITEGPFSDIEGIFVANDGAERVVLLLSLLHHEQKLRFPLSSVRKSSFAQQADASSQHVAQIRSSTGDF
jgi:transcriptional antiterminator RfaH